jgi:hypothetical protein
MRYLFYSSGLEKGKGVGLQQDGKLWKRGLWEGIGKE